MRIFRVRLVTSAAVLAALVFFAVVWRHHRHHAADSVAAPPELRLLAMGDWGENNSAQSRVAWAMSDYLVAPGPAVNGLLSVGDNFYVPLSGTDDPAWQRLFEKMYDPDQMKFPFYVALGNHDCEPGKVEIELAYAKEHPASRWKLPARWYRLDLPAEKPLVTVIVLDSDHNVLTHDQWMQQQQFLEGELKKQRAAWTVCCAHHPLYSNGVSADNGILQHDWGTLFQKYGVDLYISGHEHNLQHIEQPGELTTFIIAGGGGAHSHPIISDRHAPFSRALYGFADLRFTAERVTVKFIGTDCKPVHSFERTKTGEVNVTFTTPSDPPLPKPLAAIQGLFNRQRSQTQPTTAATAP